MLKGRKRGGKEEKNSSSAPSRPLLREVGANWHFFERFWSVCATARKFVHSFQIQIRVIIWFPPWLF